MLVVRSLPRISAPVLPLDRQFLERQLYMLIPQLFRPTSHGCELNTVPIRMSLQNLELSQYIEPIRY